MASILPIGKCCAGIHCKFPFLSLNPSHKCVLCGKIIHMLCGELVIGTDNIECFKCAHARSLIDSNNPSPMADRVNISTNASLGKQTNDPFAPKRCPRCNSSTHQRSSSKKCPFFRKHDNLPICKVATTSNPIQKGTIHQQEA